MPQKKMTERDALEVVLEGLAKAMGILNQTGADCHSAHAKGYLAESQLALNNAIEKVNDQIVMASFYAREVQE